MARVTNFPQPAQPGFRLIDGSALNGLIGTQINSTDSGLTASTVQTRAGALQLVAVQNQVATANASDAVKLAPSGASPNGIPNPNVQMIANDSGQNIQVFPAGANDTIDGGAVGAAAVLTSAKRGVFIAVTDVGGVRTWVSFAALKST